MDDGLSTNELLKQSNDEIINYFKNKYEQINIKFETIEFIIFILMFILSYYIL